MKNIKSLFVMPIIAVLLTGCVGKKHYDTKDYVIPLQWKNIDSADFKILQLGDIHLSQSDVFEEHFKVISKTVETANPDLIVLDGDTFTFADKHLVRKTFQKIDDYGIPWTFTFGNHDDQGYYSDTYIPKILDRKTTKYQHVLFKDLKDDDVEGRSNFVINLTKHELVGGNLQVTPMYQVYIVDSHSYNFSDLGYDYIQKNQIDWFDRMADSFKVGTEYLPSSVYMHIATPEFYTAAELAQNGKEGAFSRIGTIDEWSGGPAPESDLGFFEHAKTHGVKAICCAHEHINDSVIYYQGVDLCFGVHSTDRIYKDDAKIGGQLVTINHLDQKKLGFANIYVNTKTLDVKVENGKELVEAR